VSFIEVDALVHGPNWTETPTDVLAERLAPVLASDGWVIVRLRTTAGVGRSSPGRPGAAGARREPPGV
jgi:hypothetical protein